MFVDGMTLLVGTGRYADDSEGGRPSLYRWHLGRRSASISARQGTLHA
jgi:hypothetical protein